MQDKKTFIPGFETREKARQAGRKFFKKTNGLAGVEGIDFHLVENEHGRWHFDPGAKAKSDRAEFDDKGV